MPKGARRRGVKGACFLETVLLDERWVELQSRFLGGVLAGKEGNQGLALVTLELDHLFAIVFDDVAVASCFERVSWYVAEKRLVALVCTTNGMGLTKVLLDLLQDLLAAELLGETGHSSDGLATIAFCCGMDSSVYMVSMDWVQGRCSERLGAGRRMGAGR